MCDMFVTVLAQLSMFDVKTRLVVVVVVHGHGLSVHCALLFVHIEAVETERRNYPIRDRYVLQVQVQVQVQIHVPMQNPWYTRTCDVH